MEFDFNPRSPHGERQAPPCAVCIYADFNPRSPHGERRHVTTPLLPVARISIHAPRTGSDGNGEGNTLNARISIHAPRTGSDQQFQCGLTRCIRFQSTLPARGATPDVRSCVEIVCISIHAPRTGSDPPCLYLDGKAYRISIHAPRTGSDKFLANTAMLLRNFNPRSPHGERRFADCVLRVLKNFNPRSPHGERHQRRLVCGLTLEISIHAPRTGSDLIV